MTSASRAIRRCLDLLAGGAHLQAQSLAQADGEECVHCGGTSRSRWVSNRSRLVRCLSCEREWEGRKIYVLKGHVTTSRGRPEHDRRVVELIDLERAVGRIPESERCMMVLRDGMGHSAFETAEIATTLRIGGHAWTEVEATKALRRGRRKLVRILDGARDDERGVSMRGRKPAPQESEGPLIDTGDAERLLKGWLDQRTIRKMIVNRELVGQDINKGSGRRAYYKVKRESVLALLAELEGDDAA